MLYCLNSLEHIICSAHHLLLKTTHRVKKHIKLLSINSQSLLPFFALLSPLSLFLLSGNKSSYFVGKIWSFLSMVYYINKDEIDWNKKGKRKHQAKNLVWKLNKFFNLQKVTLIHFPYQHFVSFFLELLNVYYLRLL